MAREAVLETVTMSLGDDGILRIKITEGAEIGLTQARLQSEMVRRLCGDARMPVLVDARASHSITREAQAFGAQQAANRIATAVLSGNPFAALSLNFFVSIFKPSSSFKAFTDEEAAVEWLRQQK